MTRFPLAAALWWAAAPILRAGELPIASVYVVDEFNEANDVKPGNAAAAIAFDSPRDASRVSSRVDWNGGRPTFAASAEYRATDHHDLYSAASAGVKALATVSSPAAGGAMPTFARLVMAVDGTLQVPANGRQDGAIEYRMAGGNTLRAYPNGLFSAQLAPSGAAPPEGTSFYTTSATAWKLQRDFESETLANGSVAHHGLLSFDVPIRQEGDGAYRFGMDFSVGVTLGDQSSGANESAPEPSAASATAQLAEVLLPEFDNQTLESLGFALDWQASDGTDRGWPLPPSAGGPGAGGGPARAPEPSTLAVCGLALALALRPPAGRKR